MPGSGGELPRLHQAAPQSLPAALNSFLPQDIVVWGCEEVAEDFNARRSAWPGIPVLYI